jgi:uncharacterized protein (DUF1697 family)
MTDVVTVFETAGCRAVRSVGHAGNLVWRQGARSVSIRKAHQLLVRLLGKTADIMTRTAAEIAAIVASDPFGAVKADATVKRYVVFLAQKPKRVPPLPLRLDKEALELIAVRHREAYVVSRRIPGRDVRLPEPVRREDPGRRGDQSQLVNGHEGRRAAGRAAFRAD